MYLMFVSDGLVGLSGIYGRGVGNKQKTLFFSDEGAEVGKCLLLLMLFFFIYV